METLDENANGHAILQVAEEEDKQELVIPEGITVQWLVQTKSGAKRNEQWSREMMFILMSDFKNFNDDLDE